MYEHRGLLAILFTCITFVGVVAGANIARLDKSPLSIPANTKGLNEVSDIPQGIDKLFYAPTPQTESVVDTEKPVKPKEPVLAESYIVGDVATGKIYMEKNSTRNYPFASMSKLITAMVAKELYSDDAVITITSQEAEVPKDGSGVRAEESFTLKELLYPLLLNSSNIAGEAIGSSSDRTKFLEAMSSYSWEIGMKNAFFADPTGLSERNAGSAAGFFDMASYIYNRKPEILAITRTKKTSVATTTSHGAHDFTSIHPFINDPRFIGGKTGHTAAALDTMLTILDIHEHPIAIIVLRSPGARAQDTSYLASKVSSMLAN